MRQRLDGERGHKLQGVRRGGHAHLVAVLLEQPDEVHGLVSRDASGDAYDNVFAHSSELFFVDVVEIDLVVFKLVECELGRLGQLLVHL